MSRVYAGIGSRDTPPEALELIERVAFTLAAAGWTLRSGRAAGADQAFEEAAAQGGGNVEIFLPWPGFQRDDGNALLADHHVRLSRPTPAALQLAAQHHPAWERLGNGPRNLHGRNSHQVFGADLDDPVSFVCCWTPDGAVDRVSRHTGGTGQALRLAIAFGVEVINLARPDHAERARRFTAAT